jgi:hypothetical protein
MHQLTFANWRFEKHQKFKLKGQQAQRVYTCTNQFRLGMVKKRKSNNRLEKDRQDSCERMLTFAQKKVEEQAVKDSQAWKHSLELLGLTQEFNHLDHSKFTTMLIMQWRPRSSIETVDRSTRDNV